MTPPTVLRAARWADVDTGQVRSPAVLVVDGGHPTGIITRSDLLDFLSGQGR